MTETQDAVHGFSHTSIMVKGKAFNITRMKQEFDKISPPISDVADTDVLLWGNAHLHFLKQVI